MPGRNANAATPPIALTMGEPPGIGLDITLKAWHARDTHGVPAFCFYGDGEALAERKVSIGLDDVPLVEVTSAEAAARHFRTALPFRSIPAAVPVVPGTLDARNANAVLAAIEAAVVDVKHGAAAAIVTNPISKAVLYEAGFQHPGHTEFLAELAARHWPGRTYHPVMMLTGKDLKVVPMTIHIPLAAVPRHIKPDLIADTVRITSAAMQRDFGYAKPRLAVAGLNPHAGEDGTMGREEVDVIIPTLDALRLEGYEIIGPLPADTMFHESARAKYDVAICMYHDQALIPVKTLAFDEGVNVTLGLPFARTSPDHGTALSLAGTGEASPLSLIEALKLAHEVSAQREKAPA